MNKRRNAIVVKLCLILIFTIFGTELFLKTDHVNQNYLDNFKKFICKRIKKDSYVGRVYFFKLLESFQNSFKISMHLYKEQGKVKFIYHLISSTMQKRGCTDLMCSEKELGSLPWQVWYCTCSRAPRQSS